MSLDEAHSEANAPATPHATHVPRHVTDYYRTKTDSILKKYGPGPRIHFHVGLLDAPPTVGVRDPLHHRRTIVAAQEALMRLAAESWDARRWLTGEVLDVGCGLGGGSLFWAQEYQSNVTALTVAAEHIPIINELARQAGVAPRVNPVLADACAFQTQRQFDAAVAFEASCYLPRQAWFRRLKELVRPGGVVCVEEPFARAGDYRVLFDRYWRTHVGSVQEYADAAAAAGFTLEQDVDLTDQTAEFWRHSIAWSESVLATEELEIDERRRLATSIQQHEYFYNAWRLHGIEIRILKFRLR
ncbi:SAM-dependent methyltransferase [Sorangium sp. So ce385]|uniref:SAM-dependent methyltransferase n=1 Tax=Sorangium sp. So ce385 TaxID=3133308 RepID=UPI003F5B2FA8